MFTELMATTLKPEEGKEKAEEGDVRNINLLRGGGQEIFGCKGSQSALVLLIKVSWREGKELGSEEEKAMEVDCLVVRQQKEEIEQAR
jgi:hypothetical protein